MLMTLFGPKAQFPANARNAKPLRMSCVKNIHKWFVLRTWARNRLCLHQLTAQFIVHDIAL